METQFALVIVPWILCTNEKYKRIYTTPLSLYVFHPITLLEAEKAKWLATSHPPTQRVTRLDLAACFYFRLVLALSQARAITQSLLLSHE